MPVVAPVTRARRPSRSRAGGGWRWNSGSVIGRLCCPAVAYFKDDQEVYRYIGKLFQDLMADAELGPQFKRANTIVQYQYRNPESTVTVKMLEGQDGEVDLGETALEP